MFLSLNLTYPLPTPWRRWAPQFTENTPRVIGTRIQLPEFMIRTCGYLKCPTSFYSLVIRLGIRTSNCWYSLVIDYQQYKVALKMPQRSAAPISRHKQFSPSLNLMIFHKDWENPIQNNIFFFTPSTSHIHIPQSQIPPPFFGIHMFLLWCYPNNPLIKINTNKR